MNNSLRYFESRELIREKYKAVHGGDLNATKAASTTTRSSRTNNAYGCSKRSATSSTLVTRSMRPGDRGTAA
jgi:hypothetical protein